MKHFDSMVLLSVALANSDIRLISLIFVFELFFIWSLEDCCSSIFLITLNCLFLLVS